MSDDAEPDPRGISFEELNARDAVRTAEASVRNGLSRALILGLWRRAEHLVGLLAVKDEALARDLRKRLGPVPAPRGLDDAA